MLEQCAGMVKSLISMQNEISEALKWSGNYDLLLKTLDWNTLTQLSTFLEPFKTLTEEGSKGIVGLSVMLLIRARISTVCAASASDLHEIAELKRLVLARLDARFPLNRFVLAVTLFNSASKNKKYLSMTIEHKHDLLLGMQKAEVEVGSVVTDAAHFTESVVAATISGDRAAISNLQVAKRTQAEPKPKPKRLHLLDDYEDENSDKEWSQ